MRLQPIPRNEMNEEKVHCLTDSTKTTTNHLNDDNDNDNDNTKRSRFNSCDVESTNR